MQGRPTVIGDHTTLKTSTACPFHESPPQRIRPHLIQAPLDLLSKKNINTLTITVFKLKYKYYCIIYFEKYYLLSNCITTFLN